ncbi:MAG: hypothetical protein GEU82_11865 [Luteitalea sp.]|nr:hypothetical protein [Luteitalea sp.]
MAQVFVPMFVCLLAAIGGGVLLWLAWRGANAVRVRAAERQCAAWMRNESQLTKAAIDEAARRALHDLARFKK